MLKQQYHLDIRHAKMVQEMAKFHARDRGTTADSQLTMARIIEIVYAVWKHKPSILHEEAAPPKSNHAIVLYEEQE